ncbi:MAG: cell division protein FtsL [Actinomycetota bacterium]
MTAILPEHALTPAVPEREGRRRPPLHVVRDGRSPARRRARARLLAVLVLVVVTAALFGLVASHVALTQGQFELEELRKRAATEEARYERLRLQVAELESPGRIVAAAQERLGMVPPPGVTYLSPVGPASGLDDGADADRETAADDWSTVKRELASRP